MAAKVEGWVTKLVARLAANAALWVRIQTFLKKYTKWATLQKEWLTHSSPPIQKTTKVKYLINR